MLPTPSTAHVSFTTIYEPAEDSFLLLDTFSSPVESAWLQQRFPLSSSSSTTTTTTSTPSLAPLVAEIGTGSGVVIAFIAAHAKRIFGRADVLALGVDVNVHACAATKLTIERALLAEQEPPPPPLAVYLGSVCADLCTVIRDHSVDVLIFNPPYVPSEELPALPQPTAAATAAKQSANGLFELESHLLALSYAGGRDGMETTNRLLGDLERVLSGRGVAYVLLCKRNAPEEVKARIIGRGEWRAETVGRSGVRAGWERLEVLRIWREGHA
jgi:release factor glutamine methyltransferase